MSIRGQAEGLVCTDPGARTPICMSRISRSDFPNPHFVILHKQNFKYKSGLSSTGGTSGTNFLDPGHYIQGSGWRNFALVTNLYIILQIIKRFIHFTVYSLGIVTPHSVMISEKWTTWTKQQRWIEDQTSISCGMPSPSLHDYTDTCKELSFTPISSLLWGRTKPTKKQKFPSTSRPWSLYCVLSWDRNTMFSY